MNPAVWLAWLLALLASLGEAAVAALAWVLDRASDLGPLDSALCAVLLLAVFPGVARSMQGRLVRRIAQGRRAGYLRQELPFLLPLLPFRPIVLLARAIARGAAAITRRLRRLVSERGRDPSEESRPEASEADEPHAPFLAATLGPSFLLGALATVLVFLLAQLLEPLIAWRLELAPDTPVWQYLILGGYPELAPFLPLGRRLPFFAALVMLLVWSTVWWWASRLVRLAFWQRLGGDLSGAREDPGVLPPWRDGFAAHHLTAPSPPYRRWAGWLLAAAAPLAAWAWSSLAAVPHRVGAEGLALGLVVGTAWATHLLLRGEERTAGTVTEEGTLEKDRIAGWPEVRADLTERLQMSAEWPWQDPRPLLRLATTPLTADDTRLLSPLLAELLPAAENGGAHLTPMQRKELHRLSRLGHVATRPEPAPGELRLGESVAEREGEGVRHRNRIVLAPEGTGKTTLAMLAAANHTLVHSRSTLFVARDAAAAEDLHRRLGERIDPSTLRWNLRLRRTGEDLPGDLARGILPDLLIADLEHLVTGLLERQEDHEPFLANLGLIVIDDCESFAGAVEIHAQLALRRLRLACRKILQVSTLGEENAPLVLALASESMGQTARWVARLCGIEAEVERYPERPDDELPAADGRERELYRLADFRDPAGERLTPAALVESCERLGVSWCYRDCRDGRRGIGRRALHLPDEPSHATDDPADAAVVLLSGPWSSLRREIERLPLAGSRYPQGPCALVGLGSTDAEMAFTHPDRRAPLARELASLPRPALRLPTRRIAASHLAADLTAGWTEVEDLIDVFGAGCAGTLRRLAGEELLQIEKRTDLARGRHEYRNELLVRAQSQAIAAEDAGREALLPAKVAQVELASERIVPVIDRTNRSPRPLFEVDAPSAPFVYYPSRVFSTTEGPLLVVERASEELARNEALPRGAILAEPLLDDAVSSPRRRFRFEIVDGGRGPEPRRIGEQPLEVALAQVEVRLEHHATYLLGPTFGEVRQRRRLDAAGRRLGELETEALLLYPNPASADDGPRLSFAGARLLAAVLRAVLPTFVRGADDGIEVGLHLREERPVPVADSLLEHDEALALFDLHHLGNGLAAILHRDGVELLLRLARLYLERVLYHDRLLALHDQWPEDDLHSLRPGEPTPEVGSEEETLREREAALRRDTLTWLDSRLQPEGGTVAASAVAVRRSAGEPGEGDPIDEGRCWYSRDGSLTDLVWARHRYRLPDGRERLLDVGFEREIAEEARTLEVSDSPVLEAGRERFREQLVADQHALPDGTVWGAPRAAWRIEGEGEEARPHSSQPGDAAVADFHETALALAFHAAEPVAPLAVRIAEVARRLGPAAGRAADDGPEPAPGPGEIPDPRDERHGADAPSSDPGALASELAALVAAALTEPTADEEVSRSLRPPVDLLLARRGSVHSKSLLVALLLESCGVPAGIFFSPAERRSFAAAALVDPLDEETRSVRVFRDTEGKFAREEESTGEPELYQRGTAAARRLHRHLEEWSRRAGLVAPPPLWAELARSPDPGSALDLYVPVETAASRRPGEVTVARADTWIFLPFAFLRRHLPSVPGSPSATPDGATSGSRIVVNEGPRVEESVADTGTETPDVSPRDEPIATDSSPDDREEEDP